MFETVLTADQALSGLLAVLWLWAGYRVGGLRHRPPHRLRVAAQRTLVLLGVATMAMFAKLLAVALLAAYGWDLVADRVWVELPLLLVPVVIALYVAAPQLRRLVGGEDVDPGAARLVIPVQSTATGAVLSLYTAIAAPPAPPYVVHLGPLALVLAAATALLWWRLRRRADRPRKRPLTRLATVVAVLAVLAGSLLAAAQASRLPDRMSMAAGHAVDLGGGPAPEHAGHGGPAGNGGAPVTELTGPRTGEPDARFTLTARTRTISLTSGAVVDALTFDGLAPGPELRVREGDLVEVTLRNALADGGVTIHWHGVDLPNAEDGVAGVTQDAVPHGGQHVYRFRAERAGTFWYHSHQQSSVQVRRGLFGALVVLPRGAAEITTDVAVLAHTWDTDRGERAAFGTADATVERRAVPPGSPVRLRLVNADAVQRNGSAPKTFTLSGTPYRVAAIDGVDLVAPTELVDVALPLARGGRYDLIFTMPPRPVLLGDGDEPGIGLLLSPDGSGAPPPAAATRSLFDPSTYGTPAPTPFGPDSAFDRDFTLILGDRIGFFDGAFGDLSTINGRSFPDTPTLMVATGDAVRTRLVNGSHEMHPFHLHGHHALVLTRNGVPVTGSPWWTDTLDIAPGETFEIAFRADNPGVWMDHCHNLEHAADGMTMHLTYAGFSSPFEVGRGARNQPE